jgi:16S rRNA (cytidine1402-2'-O)-methyltransferase
MKAVLYLLPNLLGEDSQCSDVFAPSVERAVLNLDHLIAESESAGRLFLKRFPFTLPKTFRTLPIDLLNEHTATKQKQALLAQITKGGTWGLLSDCGMPCLADPGEDFVFQARAQGVIIKALVGPSSLMLALVLSGLGGQRFTFHGYLPRKEKELIAALEVMELRAAKENAVHLFIETPYRNEKLFNYLIYHLKEKTLLCLATDLTLPGESVQTKTIFQWKKAEKPKIDNRPTVFLVKSFLSP